MLRKLVRKFFMQTRGSQQTTKAVPQTMLTAQGVRAAREYYDGCYLPAAREVDIALAMFRDRLHEPKVLEFIRDLEDRDTKRFEAMRDLIRAM